MFSTLARLRCDHKCSARQAHEKSTCCTLVVPSPALATALPAPPKTHRHESQWEHVSYFPRLKPVQLRSQRKESDHKADGLHHTARIRRLNTRANLLTCLLLVGVSPRQQWLANTKYKYLQFPIVSNGSQTPNKNI